VVLPARITSAETSSTISTSMSVAVRARVDPSARNRTLYRRALILTHRRYRAATAAPRAHAREAKGADTPARRLRAVLMSHHQGSMVLERTGMVPRRSTTLWTWAKERSKATRSMVSFK